MRLCFDGSKCVNSLSMEQAYHITNPWAMRYVTILAMMLFVL